MLDDELAPFLSATSDARARYGIAPPAAPVYRPSELVDIARRHHDRVITAKSEVDARIGDCWNAAVEGALDACAVPLPPAVATVDAALADYVATGRIVPVRFAAKGVLGYGGAKDACVGSGMRLPTLVEAQRLAMPVGYLRLPRTGEDRLRYAVWHANTSKCGNGELPAFSNPPTGTSGNLCTPDNWLNPHPTLTLCVPHAGPIEPLPAP